MKESLFFKWRHYYPSTHSKFCVFSSLQNIIQLLYDTYIYVSVEQTKFPGRNDSKIKKLEKDVSFEDVFFLFFIACCGYDIIIVYVSPRL